MIPFEELPQATRSLLLAKLNLEIVSANCANIFDLAHTRNQSINEVWRDICRKADQARCLIPPKLLETRYLADASTKSATTAPAVHSVVATTANVAASTANVRGAATVATAATVGTSLAKMEDTNAAAEAARVKTMGSARHGQRWHNRPVMLAVGLCAVLVAMGVGLYVVASPSGQTTTSTVRPTETVRIDYAKSGEQAVIGGKQTTGPANVPVSSGTVRRIDAISKSFSKK
jgi:hypothetical protein